MNKIKIICTKEQAGMINGSGCIGDCAHWPDVTPYCKDCPYDPRNIDFEIKESED